MRRSFVWYFVAGFCGGALSWINTRVKHERKTAEAAKKGEPPPPEPGLGEVAIDGLKDAAARFVELHPEMLKKEVAPNFSVKDAIRAAKKGYRQNRLG